MRFATILLGLVLLSSVMVALAQVPILRPPGPMWPTPPAGSQVASLVINTPQGRKVATAFCVSKEGYVATSFNNVRNATSATVVSSNGVSGPVTLEVTGAVAVNKARDLVILATNLRQQVLPNLVFDAKADLALQAILMPQPGPLSKPLLESVPYTTGRAPYFPHVQGKVSGENFLRGLKNNGPVGLGTDPTLEWLMLDVPLDVAYTGAPVWNETYTSIVGIVSAVGDDTPGVKYVLPIRYVLDLIAQKPATLIPLPKLANWQDPKQLPPAAEAQKLASMTRAEMLESKTTSRTKLEAHSAALQAKKQQYLLDADRAAKYVAAADQRLRTMKPSVKVKVGTRKVRSSKSKKDKGKDDDEEEDVYEYRYSEKQEQERSLLSGDMVKAQNTYLVSMLHRELVEKNFQPHTQRRLGESAIELFLTADPLELRSLEELQPLQQKLNERIQQGSQEPLDYLMRSVLLTRQRKGAAARQDLAEMVKLNAQYTPMKAVLERRLENFENMTRLPAPQSSFKSPLNELLVPLLAARIEWDNGDGKEAAKILTRWLPTHQRHADVHTALAWEMLETNPSTTVTQRQALQYAWDAIELSRGGDWLALGALTAAQVRGKDYLGAQDTMTYLAPLMPAEKAALRDAWQKAVLDKEPLVRMP